MEIVRTCTKCGSQDTSQTWPSMANAADAGAAEAAWACPTCAWPEFELGDRRDEPLIADPSGTSEPFAPVDPDEARRTLGPPTL